jgi:hypothetical protein
VNQINLETVAGIAIFFACLATLAYRATSLYFGLSILCLFMVSSASLAAYVHGLIFGAPLDWVTPSHLKVMQYSIVGCIAMVIGMLLAWNPTKGERLRKKESIPAVLRTTWINLSFGWFTLLMGSAATLAERWLHNVATVGTAVHTISSMSTFGLLVLLALGLKTNSFKHFALALLIYVPAVLMSSFASGHSPAKISLLLPALCLVSGVRRINWKSVVIAGVGGFVFLSVMTGWMQTRGMIRRGELSDLGFFDQVQRFIPAWYDASVKNAFDSQAANNTIRDRVDMTNILAMQVRHQPNIEPYAHGGTVIDSFYTLIPRAIWPSKPVTAGGSRFVMRFSGMRRNPRDTTSIGLPYQFELYANGGSICVVVGLLVIGYACAALERGLFTSTSGLGSLLGRVSMTMTLCEGGQRTDVVLPALIAGGITFYAVGKVIELSSPALTARMLGRPLKKSPQVPPSIKTQLATSNSPQVPVKQLLPPSASGGKHPAS